MVFRASILSGKDSNPLHAANWASTPTTLNPQGILGPQRLSSWAARVEGPVGYAGLGCAGVQGLL